jgi:multidrug resistance efflux pump
MNNKWNFWIMVLLTIFGAQLISGCQGSNVTPTAEPISEEEFTPVVSATGVVVPEQWAALSMASPGIVSELLVSEDEKVSTDQVLLNLDGEDQLQAAISAANFELVSAQEALDALYKNPEKRAALAAQGIVDAQLAIDDAKKRLDNLISDADPDDIDQARASVVLAKDQLDKALEDFAPYEKKPEDNLTRAVLLSRVAQTRDLYEAAVRRLNNLLGEANTLDLQEAQSDLALAEAQLVTAQRDYEILKAGPDPDNVAMAEARLASAKDQVSAAKAALEDLELRAPFDGTISEVNVRQDEWVLPGQPLMLLADLSNMQVETTDLNEIDVAQVDVGDPVTVTFDALPGIEVKGEVVEISPKSSSGAGVNYKVLVKLAEIPPQLRWGMTAFVDIAVDE